MSKPTEDVIERERAALAAYRFLRKCHRETHCGRPDHWAECAALVDAFGWPSWEAWDRAVVLGRIESPALPEGSGRV